MVLRLHGNFTEICKHTQTHSHNIHLSIPQNDTEQKKSISDEKRFEF